MRWESWRAASGKSDFVSNYALTLEPPLVTGDSGEEAIAAGMPRGPTARNPLNSLLPFAEQEDVIWPQATIFRTNGGALSGKSDHELPDIPRIQPTRTPARRARGRLC